MDVWDLLNVLRMQGVLTEQTETLLHHLVGQEITRLEDRAYAVMEAIARNDPGFKEQLKDGLDRAFYRGKYED